MRRYLLVSVVTLGLSTPLRLWARIPSPPGFEDVRGLAEEAPLVFRGRVTQLNLTEDAPDTKVGIAVIAVDRWYRGSTLARMPVVQIRFAYAKSPSIRGHDCANLVLESYWLFFAKPSGDNTLELFHDCEGALRVSRLIAAQPPDVMLAQMEADFIAGLRDSDPNGRLASILRLAGLALPGSREALHEVISYGNETESRWAIFAALRTGDISAVALAKPILIDLQADEHGRHRPESLMALALGNIRSPEAIPDLIEISSGARDSLVRSCANAAVAEIRRTAMSQH